MCQRVENTVMVMGWVPGGRGNTGRKRQSKARQEKAEDTAWTDAVNAGPSRKDGWLCDHAVMHSTNLYHVAANLQWNGMLIQPNVRGYGSVRSKKAPSNWNHKSLRPSLACRETSIGAQQVQHFTLITHLLPPPSAYTNSEIDSAYGSS